MAIGAPWVGTAVPGIAAGVAGTSATIDITGATVGEVVYACLVLADVQASNPTAPAGWSIVVQGGEGTTGAASSRCVLYRRVKQAGDTTFLFSWATSCKFEIVPISWPGVDTATPEEVATYAASTSGTTVVSASITPTAATRWAAGMFGKRGTTATETPWTPPAAMTERVDVSTSASAFTGLEVADSNATVAAAPQSYTATANASASHGGSIVWALIPAAGAAQAPARRPQLVGAHTAAQPVASGW